MLCMVQGDFTVVSIQHAIIASKTGAMAALAFIAASFLPYHKPIIGVWLTGVFVTIADFITGWSTTLIEPLCTGLGAMLIAYVFYKVRGRYGSS